MIGCGCSDCPVAARLRVELYALRSCEYADALKRLAGCRALQPDSMQVIVAAEIVDALIAQPLRDE